MKFISSKAQVTIETTALAVLAIIALLVMSSYVTRGINAYFKTGEDTIKDSFHETMLQSGQLAGPECTCDEEVSDDCGVGPCTSSQELVSFVCSPPECPVPASYCRINRNKCCRESDDCAAHGCGNGQRAFRTSCPDETPATYECETDNDCLECCDTVVPGIIYNPNLAEYCDAEDDDPVCPLSLKGDYAYLANTGFTFVEDHVDGDPSAGNGCTGAPCEIICKDPMKPIAGGAAAPRGAICDCPFPWQWDETTNTCVCNYPYILNEEGECICHEKVVLTPDNGLKQILWYNRTFTYTIPEELRGTHYHLKFTMGSIWIDKYPCSQNCRIGGTPNNSGIDVKYIDHLNYWFAANAASFQIHTLDAGDKDDVGYCEVILFYPCDP